MKKTVHFTGHKWTTDELRKLMKLWADETPLDNIATELTSTRAAILKVVTRLRNEGVPLKRRNAGHVSGRSNKAWTQGEVEYLMRRRAEKATSEEIARELDRTYSAVSGMIMKLRSESVPIAMRGNGVRRLWDAEALKATAISHGDTTLIELTPFAQQKESA